MCTAITYKAKNHYFGRNLDLYYSYHETVTITPRNFPFHFKNEKPFNNHYAMVGMATVSEGFPLYYEATNEKGLSMAGLNFPGNACFSNYTQKKQNIATYEFIPWLLGQCADVSQAKQKLENINLIAVDFNKSLPSAPLHWIISDKNTSITIESVADGMKIYDNPIGILTNNPPFDIQMFNLNNYINLTHKEPENRFSEQIELSSYSLGMGALGLPGDFSSASRFVRAAFTKLNSYSTATESSEISQVFHILNSVSQPRGCVKTADGKYEFTIYTSCCNTDKGLYYYKTYENSQISCINIYNEDLNGNKLILFPLISGQQIKMQNQTVT